MKRRNFVGVGGAILATAGLTTHVSSAVAQTASLTVLDTIDDLLNVGPQSISDNQYVIVKGFDEVGDNCGGVFYWSSETLTIELIGVAMNSHIEGSWHRHYEGAIHTRWVGIKPSKNRDVFDSEGIASVNLQRWNGLSNYCKQSIWEVISPDKTNIVENTIFLDSGVHDFTGGSLQVGQGVGVDGCGPGRSTLRFNTSSGVCVQVGDEGDTGTNTSLESSFDIIKNISIVHFSLASTGSETGISFDNTIRRSELYNVHVQGFNINVDVNAFGMDIRNCFIAGAYTRNLKIGPQANSMMVVGCRIDDQRKSNGGENVLVDNSGGARNILFLRCEIQRSQRVAFRVIGVASFAIRDCFFEGNNRSDGHHPDIWIEGPYVRNIVIDGCYFTGTGRFNGTTSRAINIRSNVSSNARFQISNNQQSSGAQGSFAAFIDVDANTAMQIVEFNNLHDAPNSIPGNVLVKTFS